MRAAPRATPYCTGRLKRAFDLLTASAAVLLLSPILGAIATLIRVTSGPPVLFRQERVGRRGKPFRIMKFRTMHAAASGLPITGQGDERVTPIGRLLRRSKLDELPQLLNVVIGHMSLVGPRPELPRYVASYPPEWRRVLDVRPGLTDDATLLFRDEERLLGEVPLDMRERYYVEEILPRKLELNLRYLERAGFLHDLLIILKTLGAIAARRRP
jgi:lipopolysaccharide/colanic/teichoic acid biosynthesis glycosyltransferase